MELSAYPNNWYNLRMFGISFYESSKASKHFLKGVKIHIRTILDASLEDESMLLLWN